MDFKSLIKNKNAKVAVIGLGYVGLPLSLSFLDQGYEVIGVDLNKTKIRSIQSGKSYITDI
jgi:UDP-N-acetyl-D-glucosamine dehydrogenase